MKVGDLVRKKKYEGELCQWGIVRVCHANAYCNVYWGEEWGTEWLKYGDLEVIQ